MTEVEQVLKALSSIRICAQPEEYDIHDRVSQALQNAGLSFTHEYRLMPGRRIDFLCGSIGIEVKKGRPASASLRKQLARYLESDALSCVVVVLQKPCNLPAAIHGKPVYTVSLNRLWGVALP